MFHDSSGRVIWEGNIGNNQTVAVPAKHLDGPISFSLFSWGSIW